MKKTYKETKRNYHNSKIFTNVFINGQSKVYKNSHSTISCYKYANQNLSTK